MEYFKSRDEWHYDPCNCGQHLHENFEVVYMLSGECKAVVEKIEYNIKKGDFLVVFPFQIHEYIPLCNNSKFLVMSIEIQKLSYWIQPFTITSSNAKIDAGNTSDFLRILVSKLEEYPNMKKNSHSGIATSITQTLLLELLNMIPIEERSTIQSTNHEKILLICRAKYKDSAFNLEMLSQKTGLSIRTISRFFSNDVKVPFSRFISLMRLNHVRDLVEKRNYSITNAALESGFGTIRSFNLVFKKEFGTSPREFFKK